jgi:CHAD domain-containing protein
MTEVAAELDPDAPVAEWGRAAVMERVERLLGCVPEARRGEDPEGLHDLRVATRRLGAALRIFGDCFDGEAFRRLDRDARRVRRRSGALRDLDVLIGFLREERARLQGLDRLAMRYVLALQEADQARRREELLETLAWLEVRDLRQEARRATETVAGDARPQSLRQAAPPALIERYQGVIQYVPYVEQPEAEAELHAMRIAVKRLRYAMEMFSPGYVDRLEKPLTTARRLQEALGELHDSDVRRALLADLAAARPRGRALRRAAPATWEDIVAGLPLLLDAETERRAQIYQEFRRLWRKLEARGFPETLLARLQSPDAPPARQQALGVGP